VFEQDTRPGAFLRDLRLSRRGAVDIVGCDSVWTFTCIAAFQRNIPSPLTRQTLTSFFFFAINLILFLPIHTTFPPNTRLYPKCAERSRSEPVGKLDVAEGYLISARPSVPPPRTHPTRWSARCLRACVERRGPLQPRPTGPGLTCSTRHAGACTLLIECEVIRDKS
jgi:hypothetical protein